MNSWLVVPNFKLLGCTAVYPFSSLCVYLSPHSAKDISVILSHLSTHISYLKGTASLLSRQMEANPSLIDPSQVGGSRVAITTICACTITSNGNRSAISTDE